MLVELIDKYYREKREAKNQEHFYITDAGKCQRAVYFAMKGFPRKEKEARVLRIFDRGDITHQRLMRALFGVPEVKIIASEVDITPTELIHGRADAIISVGNKLYVVDFKSANDFRFQKLDVPESSHQQQLQLYMHYFKIPQGFILYENKNTQELKEFEVKYDYKLCKKIISELEDLKEQYIDQNIFPPIPLRLKQKRKAANNNEGKFPWECDYCDFREECDRVEGEVKKKKE
jgi:CRISPR/Cas system-associated exonuclease Cas4 (RecB family)